MSRLDIDGLRMNLQPYSKELQYKIMHRLAQNPSASGWARQAVIDLMDRDPVDALHDVQGLMALMQERVDELLGKPAKRRAR